jgi:hypothetical protein
MAHRGIANQARIYARHLSECVTSRGENTFDAPNIAFCIERLRRSVADLKGALERSDRSGPDATPVLQ